MRIFPYAPDGSARNRMAMLHPPFDLVPGLPAGFQVMRHYDFEVEAFGEFWESPFEVGAATIAQHADASHPDRPASIPGAGVLVTLSEGAGTAYLVHDMRGTEDVLHVRFVFNPSTINGAVQLLLALDVDDAEAWNISFDPATFILAVEIAGGASLSATLSSGIAWHAIELSIDITGDVALLHVDGIERDGDTGASGQARTIRFGCTWKDEAAEGAYFFDEFKLAAEYIGPINVVPTLATAADPARWLVVYNAADADSIAWAETYRAARHVPHANLCGLDLPTDEVIDEAEWEDMALAIAAYVTLNLPADQIAGILLGHGCPGVIDADDDCSVVSALAGMLAIETDNPRYLPGVVNVADLPARSTLISGGPYLVAEMQAIDVADAEALVARSLALVWRRGLSALDPTVDCLAASAPTWADLAAFLDDLAGMQIRLPAAAEIDGHGYSIEFTDATDGAFDVDDQARALLVSIGAGAASELRDGDDLVTDAITAGYALAIGYIQAPGSEQLVNPAPLMAALRSGWTWAEAIALAMPSIGSTWRVVGDPLATMPLPLEGYNVYSRPLPTAADALIAVYPAGEPPHVLDGFTPNSEQYVSVKSVTPCGVEDIEARRLVRLAFDSDGNFIGPVPSRPVSVSITQSQGVVSLHWNYVPNGEAISPARFVAYRSIDGGAWEAMAPTLYAAARIFTKALGTHSHGVRIAAKVVAVSAAGDEGAPSASVGLIVDHEAPSPASSIELEVS